MSNSVGFSCCVVPAWKAENDSLKGSIVQSLGDRGRELVAKCVPEDVGGLVTSNPTQATKVRVWRLGG